jgi:hypothetical protein
MNITVLVVVFDGAQSITLHDGEAAAEKALIAFVEHHWAERFDEDYIEMTLSDTERLRQFFADDRYAFIIADADLSPLEELIDAARQLAPRLAGSTDNDP